MTIDVREVREDDHPWVCDLLKEHWGSVMVVTRGRKHYADQLPGFIAVVDGVRGGLLTYRVENGICEITTLDSLREGHGIGSRLLEAVRNAASMYHWKRVWLITTNDNFAAQGFYERRGFRRVAIHENAIAVSRKLKPEIPEVGIGGVPIRDEIEFELARLTSASADAREERH